MLIQSWTLPSFGILTGLKKVKVQIFNKIYLIFILYFYPHFIVQSSPLGVYIQIFSTIISYKNVCGPLSSTYLRLIFRPLLTYKLSKTKYM